MAAPRKRQYLEPTDESVRRLQAGVRKALTRFQNEDVERFARSMGAIGNAEIYAKYPERSRIRDLRKLLDDTVKFRRSLRKLIMRNPFPSDIGDVQQTVANLLAPYVTFSDERRPDGSPTDRFYDVLSRARVAVADLQSELQQAIDEATPAGRGRPRCDRHGLLKHLARRYRTCFNEDPSSTMGSPFYTVCLHVLEHVTGSSPKDASRQVAAAVRAVRRK